MSEFSAMLVMKNSQTGNKIERNLITGASSFDTTQGEALNLIANAYQALTTDSLYGGSESPYYLIIEKRDTIVGGQGTVTVQPGVDYFANSTDALTLTYYNTLTQSSKSMSVLHPSTPQSESTEDIEEWQYLVRRYAEALADLTGNYRATTAKLKQSKVLTEFSTGGDD